MRWIARWFRRDRPNSIPTEPLHLVLYTRSGCHLCDDALRVLDANSQDSPFTLQLIDIDQDPRLVQQFGECVPVITVNGRVRFRGRIQPALLKRILQNQRDQTPRSS